MEFVVDDVSQWYVRANRSRFWAVDSVADPAALATLHEAMVTVSRLLAPAAPFASDWLHRALTGTSVHLARFPEITRERDPALEAAMDAIRRLASLAHGARQERKLPVRQPLARMQVAVPTAVRGPALNVKSIETVSSDADLVRLRGRPNFRSLGKRYGKRTPQIAAAASGLTADQLRGLEQGLEAALDVDGERVTYLPEDVVVEREVASDWIVASDGPYVVALDPRLTDELRREGTAREVVNRIQRLRKEAGYVYTDRIGVWMDGGAPVLEAARVYAEFIRGETLARRLELGARAPTPDLEQRVDIDGHGVVVGVQRDRDGRAGNGPQLTDRA
jgi:isoleucyl-tRNA synthetase